MIAQVKTGLVLPAATASVSPAAPFALASAIAANAKSYQIASLPRTVFDQRDVLCCVSCALASAMETINPAWPELSPLFHYHVTRYENAGADADGSLLLESGVATLGMQGICRQDLHAFAFDAGGAAAAPSPTAYDDASTRVLRRSGIRSRTLLLTGTSIAAEMREQLDQDRPVVAAFRLPAGYPDSFLNPQIQWDDSTAPLAANGHCALIFGYNDFRRAFHIQDSRGRDRFDAGCWWLGYDVVDSRILQNAYSLLP